MEAGESDPRVGLEPSVRPVVEPPRRLIPTWAIIAGILLLGLFLFVELNARRLARSAPVASVPAAERLASDAPPPLYVPPAIAEPVVATAAPVAAPVALPPVPLVATPPAPMPAPQIVQGPSPPLMLPPVQQQAQARGGDAQVVVYDARGGSDERSGGVGSPGSAPASVGAAAASGGASANTPVAMVRARPRAANPSTIVPQGTLIPAVLETALDSTRAGATRALVTRDVEGFDGKRVLIPRGSRLYGQYQADLAPGQKRALVVWNRLVRPDGVSVDLDSPAADPLGRNGIGGKVNNHFFERFSGALLQTALDIGANVAVREISSGSIAVLAIPSTSSISGGSGSGLVSTGNIQRTLIVRQGTSVSVFVARDLDFSGVDGR